MRKYQEIWERLKKKDTVTLKVHDVGQLRRIKKAVQKEKYSDFGFKVCNDFDKWTLVSNWNETTSVLVLKLNQKFGLEDKVL